MVVYGEETKGKIIFDTYTCKTFVERSVKFEEEPIPDFERALGECSSPQPFEDVSDYTCSVFSDMYDINVSEHDIPIDDSPSCPKWAKKIVQAAEELASNSHVLFSWRD